MPDLAFTAADLKRLAGDTVFKRGEDYARSDAVRLSLVTPERIEASVVGSEIYEVTLEIPRAGEIEAGCTCPHADEGNFCKHAVAAGLAALKQGVSGKTGPKRPSDKELLADHLAAMSKETLHARLMKAADAEPRLKRALVSEAIAARSSVEDTAAWRRLIDNTFRAARTVSWESAGDFPEALDGLESSFRSVLSPKTAPLFLDLIEEIIPRAEKATEEVHDENGEVLGALEGLARLHRDACATAGLAPEALAERLFAFETGERSEFVSFGPEPYKDALGPVGLRRYRELVEGLARETPSTKDPHWRLDDLRSTLAKLCGDTDARIALIEAQPHHRLSSILDILLEAGRADEALARAERARDANPRSLESAVGDFLIATYAKAGRHSDALAVAREDYAASPDIAGYKRLIDLARVVGCERETRETAVAQSLARPRIPSYDGLMLSEGRRGPDRNLRVEIALWENDLDAGVAAADAGSVRQAVLNRLAAALVPVRPADSLRIRQRIVASLLHTTNAKNYPDVVAQVDAMHESFRTGPLADAFAAFLKDLRATHGAKRSLMAMLEGKRKR